ncbi:hypothetical protein RHDC2_00397 [Rhodocyclaceae bacterium]|nr:hypothetical protein RHDC2_00397 [Rhodocyclaceae bacterium]
MQDQATVTSKKGSAKTTKSKPDTIKSLAKRQSARSGADASGSAGQSALNGEDRYNRIATAAYYRAERRGFNSGGETEDWLAAEAEIDAMLYH